VHDFKFHKQGFQSLRTTLGTWLQYTWSWNNFSFTPLVDIGWQREFLDRNHKVDVTPVHVAGPKDSFTVFGAGRDTLLAGLDLLFEFYDTYGIEASYGFEYNSLYRNNGFYLGFNVNF
jgi:outer membrane autotransporter protein